MSNTEEKGNILGKLYFVIIVDKYILKAAEDHDFFCSIKNQHNYETLIIFVRFSRVLTTTKRVVCSDVEK